MISGGWWLPFIPASPDFAENVLTAVLVDQNVTGRMAQLLCAVATLKFVAYVVVVGIVLVRQLLRRTRV